MISGVPNKSKEVATLIAWEQFLYKGVYWTFNIMFFKYPYYVWYIGKSKTGLI